MANPATPGIKTSEFWLNLLAVLLTALFAADVIPTGTTLGKAIAIAATVLTSLGYTVSRGALKSANATAAKPEAPSVNVSATATTVDK